MSSTTAPEPELLPQPALDARPATASGAGSGRIAGADGLRALAALGVIFSHLFQRLSMGDQPEWLAAVQGVAMKGAYGVSIFFVLSGMLLSLPFWRAYITGAPRPQLGHYARRRAARIVPGFYASLIISFAVGLLIFPTAERPVLRLLAGFTFTSGFWPLTFFPTETNGPLWSISLEVVSYVLMPLAMVALFALRRRGLPWRERGAAPSGSGSATRRWSVAPAVRFWLGTFVVVLLVNQWIITTFTVGDTNKGWQYGLPGGAREWMPWYNPIGFFAHFCMGILAAGAIAWWQQRSGARRWRFDALAAAGLVGLALLVWVTRFPLEPEFHGNFQNQPYLFPALAVTVGMALVGLSHSRVLGRIVDNRFARFTALVSFGLYIWHYLVLHLLSYLTNGEFEYGGVHDPVRFAWISGTVLVISYAIATASWFWLERPVLRSRWAQR